MSATPTEVRAYEPNAKQAKAHADSAAYRLLCGANGSGKTTWEVWEDILLAHEYPGSLGVVFRRYYPSLRDTTQRQYLAACPPELIAEYVRTEGREQVVYRNGSRTLFRCLDDALKLGSAQYDRASIDQAEEVEEEPARAVMLGRMRGPIGPRKVMLAANPPDDTHWLYRFFVEEADEGKAVFHLSTYDNAAHLPPGYIARMERSMTPQEKKRFLFGQWGVMAKGAPVFPAFNEDLHVGDLNPIPGRVVRRGWDPGWHRPACLFLQEDTMGGWAVLLEVLGDQEDAVRFTSKVLEASTARFGDRCPFEDYCDVAGTQTHDTGPAFVSVLRQKFGIQPHTRKLSLARSIQAVSDLLARLGTGGVPLLRVDRRHAPRTVKMFAGGYYRHPHTGEPVKDGYYDRIGDAIRYALAPAIQPLHSAYEGKPLPRSWRAA